MTCKRLGWDTLLCCVCALQCSLNFKCVLFVLSLLRVGWRIVFLMSQMSNGNGIEQHAQLSR